MLLAENRLDWLHTALSGWIKSDLEWHFLKEHFICHFSDLQLLQSWFLILICCTCMLSLHSLCFSNSDLGKISPAISQLENACISCHFQPVFLVPSPATDISLHHLLLICLCFLPVFTWHHAPCITFHLMQTTMFFKQHIKSFLTY